MGGSLTLEANDHANFSQTPNLAHYSSYPESALVPTANLMLNYVLKPIRHESFHKKYAGKRYFKVSWALSPCEIILMNTINLVQHPYAGMGFGPLG